MKELSKNTYSEEGCTNGRLLILLEVVLHKTKYHGGFTDSSFTCSQQKAVHVPRAAAKAEGQGKKVQSEFQRWQGP